jgi:hypothetical protein
MIFDSMVNTFIFINPLYGSIGLIILVISIAILVGIFSIPTFLYKNKHVLITGGSSGNLWYFK